MGLPHPLLASRGELEEFSRRRAAGIYYGDHRVLCRLLGEYPAFVDLRDLTLGPRLVLDGFWEAWVTLAVARYLQPGMWCLDVGANYGYYSLLMAAACGPEGRVVACEPNPLLAGTYLPQNMALNGFCSRVAICQKVVSNVDGHAVDLVLHGNDFGTSSLERWAFSHRSDTVQVSTITLDRLCADWPRLDLVKIDVEGAELVVWEGMQKTLRRFPRVIIVVELHPQRDPPQTVSFLRQLELAGYLLRAISYDGDLMPTDPETILSQPQEHWMLWLDRKYAL